MAEDVGGVQQPNCHLESQVWELGLLNEDLMARLDGEPSNTKVDNKDIAKEEVTNSKGGKPKPLTEEANAGTSLLFDAKL